MLLKLRPTLGPKIAVVLGDFRENLLISKAILGDFRQFWKKKFLKFKARLGNFSRFYKKFLKSKAIFYDFSKTFLKAKASRPEAMCKGI